MRRTDTASLQLILMCFSDRHFDLAHTKEDSEVSIGTVGSLYALPAGPIDDTASASAHNSQIPAT